MSVLLWILLSIRLSAAVAWVDGELAEEEVAICERLIEHPSLDDEDREAARSWLAAPFEFDPTDVSLSERQRFTAYAAAVRTARSDGEVVEAEQVLLRRIRDELAIDAEQAQEIEDELD
jgi:uncharacterized tellurite resistance protein B-like protein